MATTVTLQKSTLIPNIGYLSVYYVDLATGSTGFTMSDTSWENVYGLMAAETADISGVSQLFFDGTNVKGTGFTAASNFEITVLGVYT